MPETSLGLGRVTVLAKLPTCSVVGTSSLGLVVVASVVLVDVARAALAQAEAVVGRPVTREIHRMREVGSGSVLL